MMNFPESFTFKYSSIVLNDTLDLQNHMSSLLFQKKYYYHNNKAKHIDIKRTKTECRLKPYVKEIPEYGHRQFIC